MGPREFLTSKTFHQPDLVLGGSLTALARRLSIRLESTPWSSCPVSHQDNSPHNEAASEIAHELQTCRKALQARSTMLVMEEVLLDLVLIGSINVNEILPWLKLQSHPIQVPDLMASKIRKHSRAAGEQNGDDGAPIHLQSARLRETILNTVRQAVPCILASRSWLPSSSQSIVHESPSC